MKSKFQIPALTAAVIFAVASVASAQVGGVGSTITPTTSAISPGSSVTLGTIQFTGDAAGATLTGFPITIGATGAGSVSNLSNCRLYDSSGNAVSGSVSPSAGSNAFTFNSPFTISAANSQTLSLRCDVASNTPGGTAFTLTGGTPVFATGLRVNLDNAPSVPAGMQDAVLANILLDGNRSGGAVSVSMIPISVTPGSGANSAHLADCRIRPALSGSAGFSGAVSVGGTQNVSLSSPIVVTGGTVTSLALSCDVSASAPVGSSFTIAITPSSVTATNASTGSGITPTSGTTSGTVFVTATVSGGTGGTGGLPGVPNTGLGGNAAITYGILALSALVALGGVALLRRAY